MEDKKEVNMSLNEMTENKTTINIRVNSYAIQKVRQYELPLSAIVETSIINFLKMDEVEKINFLAENMPSNTKVSDLKDIRKPWIEMLKEYIDTIYLSSKITKGLLVNSGIGAVTVISAVLKNRNTKEE